MIIKTKGVERVVLYPTIQPAEMKNIKTMKMRGSGWS